MIHNYKAMLQIASGMYFSTNELYETPHRAVFYTNGQFLGRDAVELPIGKLQFSTGHARVGAVMIEALDRLEKNRPDGQPEFMVATGGTELLDDVAVVIAFIANVSMSREPMVLERFVPALGERVSGSEPASILRGTFDADRLLSDRTFDAIRDFSVSLVALERDYF